MAPFFQVVIIKPTGGLRMELDIKVLFNEHLEAALKERVLDELNRVARTSQNARVKSGFSLRFASMSDDIAKIACRDLTAPPNDNMIQPNVFRAHLWPTHEDFSHKTFRDKIAPGPWEGKKDIGKEIAREGGVGGRVPNTGRNFAFVSLGQFEGLISGPPPPSSIPADRSKRAGIWMGTLVLHELGHAMGIDANGKGIMSGIISPSFDADDPKDHFTPTDVAKIKAVLEKIANR